MLLHTVVAPPLFAFATEAHKGYNPFYLYIRMAREAAVPREDFFDAV